MNVVVLVPRRADGGRRDLVWSWVSDRWAREHPTYRVFEGHHDDGPFNRSAAINRAAAQAGEWDVAVVADADSFVGADQLESAVDVAEMTGQITFAYDRFCYLNRPMSDAVMDGFAGNWWDGVEWALPGTCSSMVVVPRSLWDDVAGFDEGFSSGWGGDDVGFSLACQALGGGMQRIPGEVWHLHHPTAVAENREWVDRIERYKACDYDADKMRDLLATLRAELAPAKRAPRKKAAN